MSNFTELYKEFPSVLVQPFYHMISDVDVPYVKHLYSYRNVKGFQDDIEFFLKHYKFTNVEQIIASVNSNTPLPDYSLHLSFDDGFRELYEIVLPILLEKGVPATFFINKNFLDNREMFYRNKASLLIDRFNQQNDETLQARLLQLFSDYGIHHNNFTEAILSIEYKQKHIIDLVAEEMKLSFADFLQKEKPYLTTSQVQDMMAKGFHFGAHSLDHPKYSTISLTEQLQQTRDSMQFVSEEFRPKYKVFAFPFNDLEVSKLFYQTIFDEKTLDLSFGTAEMIDDWHPQNLQRSWFEKTELNAEDLLARNYTSRKERLAENSNIMERSYGEIRTYTVEQLEKAIDENTFWTNPETLPITKYRARAHTKNPRADKSDLALVTMYDKDILIGYLGVLPDKLYINNKELKWGWLSCWWTNPNYTGKGIGQQILNKIYELYDGHIGCSEFSSFGQAAANRSGKLSYITVTGKEFHLSNAIPANNSIQTQDIEYVQEIDNETEQFILSHRKNELTKRGKEELNWMLRYPWVLSAPFKDSVSAKLFFSSVSERFLYQAIKIKNNGRLCAFIILKIRDNKMTVPYLYFEDGGSLSKAANIILEHAAALNISSLKTYSDDLIKSIQNERPQLEFTACQKLAYFSNLIDLNLLNEIHIQDGDGDNGFT